MSLQTCLFSESTMVETGLWCELTEGIDPRRWAQLCRFLGHCSPHEFEALAQEVFHTTRSTSHPLRAAVSAGGKSTPPDVTHPLVSLGPSGLGGPYQREIGAES